MKREGLAIKKLIYLVMLLTVCCSGCWNYRGLDEMTLVTGIAIDRDHETGNYKLTFEMANTSGPVKEQGLKTKLIEAQGKTLFDAARNAKRRNNDKLYFGHIKTLIISEEIARSEDLGGIIDWFLRDSEIRQTVCLVVSQQDTAAEMFEAEGIGQPVIAFEIQEIVDADRQVTASTPYIEIYNVYNTLHGKGIELAVPAIHLVSNNKKFTTEINGCAVFKGGILAGFLTPEETRYLLYATNKIKGGLLPAISSDDGGPDTTLEVSSNKTSRSFEIEDGGIVICLKTETEVFIDEIHKPLNALDKTKITELEQKAQAELAQRIGETILKVQSEFGADIFGFGNMIYKNNPQLWNSLSENWDKTFKTLRVRIESKVSIRNTAQLKNTESG